MFCRPKRAPRRSTVSSKNFHYDKKKKMGAKGREEGTCVSEKLAAKDFSYGFTSLYKWSPGLGGLESCDMRGNVPCPLASL